MSIRRNTFAALSVSLLALLSACTRGSEYASYDDCLLGEARKAQTPDAVHVVRGACRSRFPLSEEEQARQLEAEKKLIAEAAALAQTAIDASKAPPQPGSGPQSGETGSFYIRISPEDRVPYRPAAPEDVKNGKLKALIERHVGACGRGSREDVFALFDFRARYEFATSDKRLADNIFNSLCGDEFRFQIIERFGNDGLTIAPNGRIEDGMNATSLCMKMYVNDDKCTKGMQISTENGQLKWSYR